MSGKVSGSQPLIQSTQHNTSLTMGLFTIIDSYFTAECGIEGDLKLV